MKIAMWSGPRNLSTALMYSFGNRPGMSVLDEPFYAAYLAATGLDHPLRDTVLAAGDTDPRSVATTIASAASSAEEPLFLKLMVFHMLDGFSLEWAQSCVHVHLIRHPARVIASYVAKREQPTLQDIGVTQQLDMYRRFPGPVVSSHDIREQPEKTLRTLCASIDLAFDTNMLSWAVGPKEFDGTWASHWYDSVHRSSEFAGPEGALPSLRADLARLQQAAMPAYEEMYARRLTP